VRWPPLITVGLLGAGVALLAMLWEARKPVAQLRARSRALLSETEKQMHARLVEAFPGRVVMAKVALGALLAASLTDRNRLRQRLADFVVCDQDFQVLAVILFHAGGVRDVHSVGESIADLLQAAHYGVREYDDVPPLATLRAQWPALCVE